MKYLKMLAVILGAILGILFDITWLSLAVTLVASITLVAIPFVITALISAAAYIKIKAIK